MGGDFVIVCITGMPGSGKTAAAKFLRESGFETIEMGSVINTMMKERGMEITPKSVPTFATNLRKRQGNAAVAKEIVRRIKHRDDDIAIIGVRSTAEINYFRKKLDNMVIIALIAPKLERYTRLKKRARRDDPRHISDFEFREEREKGYGVPGAIRLADYWVSNRTTIAALSRGLGKAIETARKRAGTKS